MSRGARKQIEQWMALAVKRNWTVVKVRSGHLKWRSPDGKITFTACTPNGGNRSLDNVRMQLRRAGLYGI